MAEYQPKLKWERTFPEDGRAVKDFSCTDNGEYAGRIYIIEHYPQEGLWEWAGAIPSGFKGRPISPNSGVESTAREASRRVEDYLAAMKAMIDKQQ